MTEPLPTLLDARALQAELGLRTVHEAYNLMRQLPKVRYGRRVYVEREDVRAFLEEHKVDAVGFPLGRRT